MRASLAYPASFWMLAASGFAVTGLDFLGIWIMFTTVENMIQMPTKSSPPTTKALTAIVQNDAG